MFEVFTRKSERGAAILTRSDLVRPLLFNFSSIKFPFHRTHIIDDQFSIDVLNLMLNADRQQTVGLHGKRGTVRILPFDGDLGRTVDLDIETGDTQAPLLDLRLTRTFLD